MRRREFITLLGGAAAIWPTVGRTQQTSPQRRIGIVIPYPKGDIEYEARVRGFREELARLGWTEGRNVQFDERWTADNMDRIRADAASLMASSPDVVMAVGGRVVPVLMRLSRTIPIVVPGAGDPVGVGWVESLARPGGNVTGFTFLELSMIGKMLETLKQIAPATVRVAFIYNPDNPSAVTYARAFRASAASLAIEPLDSPIHGVADIEKVLSSLIGQRDAGAFFPPDLTIQALRAEVVALVAQHRLPAIYSDAIFPAIGGLAFYGADRAELYRRAAGYVDRILRGEKPSDLPFQQPIRYHLIINRRTAKALGLDLPITLLASADEVIE